jgi:hypothetical protein
MRTSRPPRGGGLPAALPAVLRATHLLGLALGSALGKLRDSGVAAARMFVRAEESALLLRMTREAAEGRPASLLETVSSPLLSLRIILPRLRGPSQRLRCSFHAGRSPRSNPGPAQWRWDHFLLCRRVSLPFRPFGRRFRWSNQCPGAFVILTPAERERDAARVHERHGATLGAGGLTRKTRRTQ